MNILSKPVSTSPGIRFSGKLLIVLTCLVAIGVLCRSSIFWIYLNTRWNYWMLVVVSIILVALPYIFFSYVTAHFRRAIIATQVENQRSSDNSLEGPGKISGTSETLAANQPIEPGRTKGSR